MQTLRPYQERALTELFTQFRNGHRRVLTVAPPGAGKTSIFTHAVQKFRDANEPVLVLVHRKELLDQASARLDQHQIPHGVIMAGHPRKVPSALVQVASIQTLHNRPKPAARFVVVDEAHRAKAKTWCDTLDHYPDSYVAGFSASPWRLDGKGLADLFDTSFLVITPRELTVLGFLSPVTGFGYDRPDLSEVKTSHGEYNEGQLATVMSRTAIVGNIVEMWQQHASDLSTVVFAVNVEHSQLLTAQFKAVGVRAEHLDGSMGKTQREAILARVASGETQVICNVNVLTEGTDIPRLKCCILARPTKSVALYIQSVGRVRRPWGGYIARIHDHAGCLQSHGLPDADRDYSLSYTPKKRNAVNGLRTCRRCFAIFEPTEPECPACGFKPDPVGRDGPEFVAEGTVLSFDQIKSNLEQNTEARQYWATLWARNRAAGQPRWMAVAQFKKRFKKDPHWAWEHQG